MKPATVLMAFVLVIFLVVVNRPEVSSPSEPRQRAAPTTRAPRPTPTPETEQARPESRPVPVSDNGPLAGPAGDTTAIVASLVAVCLSGLAVAALASPKRGR